MSEGNRDKILTARVPLNFYEEFERAAKRYASKSTVVYRLLALFMAAPDDAKPALLGMADWTPEMCDLIAKALGGESSADDTDALPGHSLTPSGLVEHRSEDVPPRRQTSHRGKRKSSDTGTTPPPHGIARDLREKARLRAQVSRLPPDDPTTATDGGAPDSTRKSTPKGGFDPAAEVKFPSDPRRKKKH